MQESRNLHLWNRQAGLTLIELLVAVAMSGIVLAALVSLFVSTNKIFTVENKITDIQQGARGAMQLLSRDLRMAGLPQSSSCSGIPSANGTALRVRYDYDDTGTCGEDRAYQYVSSDEKLEVESNGGGYQPLAENIERFSLTYTLDDGTQTSSPTDTSRIRMVNVVLCGQISGAYSDQFNSTHCFNSTVKCRNMGLES